MDKKKIEERVLALFSMMSEAEQVLLESEIMEDLEIGSMDVLFLISSLEEEFSVKMPESMIRKIVTVGDVADAVADLME